MPPNSGIAPGLREKDVGEWSGKKKTDIPSAELEAWRQGRMLPLNGESTKHFTARVCGCWAEFILPAALDLMRAYRTKPDHDPNGQVGHIVGRILVVTSGNPIRILVGMLLGVPQDKLSTLDCDNGSVTRLRVVHDGRVFVEYVNDISHLPQVGFNRIPNTY